MMTDFYNTNHQTYFNSTVLVDPESFLGSFEKKLPVHSDVLDIGCGSGRDLLWLKEKGHNPTGLEQSDKLAELAADHSGCQVIKADLETYDFSQHRLDGIMLVGSLVHFRHEKLMHVVQNITQALKPDGYLFLSLKEVPNKGAGISLEDTYHHAKSTSWHFRDGRIFYLWQDQELRHIFENMRLNITKFSRNVSAIRSDDIWISYILNQDKT